MPLVKVNISGILPTVGYDETAMQERLATLAEMARSEWVRLAQNNLRSGAEDYIAGIQPVEVKGKWAHIHLVGGFPNDIENGKAPFDMKPGLLAGPNAKRGKNGRYNTVPFRHGTPGTTGKRVGQPMPITGKTPSGRPRSVVYLAAKKLKPSIESPTGSTVWGGRTGNFGGLGKRTQLPVAGGRPAPYTWKASPYQSMVKVAKKYKQATQNQYYTFRRVSEKSDPASWWHPGLKARHLANKVGIYLNDIVKRITI